MCPQSHYSITFLQHGIQNYSKRQHYNYKTSTPSMKGVTHINEIVSFQDLKECLDALKNPETVAAFKCAYL